MERMQTDCVHPSSFVSGHGAPAVYLLQKTGLCELQRLTDQQNTPDPGNRHPCFKAFMYL